MGHMLLWLLPQMCRCAVASNQADILEMLLTSDLFRRLPDAEQRLILNDSLCEIPEIDSADVISVLLAHGATVQRAATNPPVDRIERIVRVGNSCRLKGHGAILEDVVMVIVPANMESRRNEPRQVLQLKDKESEVECFIQAVGNCDADVMEAILADGIVTADCQSRSGQPPLVAAICSRDWQYNIRDIVDKLLLFGADMYQEDAEKLNALDHILLTLNWDSCAETQSIWWDLAGDHFTNLKSAWGS